MSDHNDTTNLRERLAAIIYNDRSEWTQFILSELEPLTIAGVDAPGLTMDKASSMRSLLGFMREGPPSEMGEIERQGILSIVDELLSEMRA